MKIYCLIVSQGTIDSYLRDLLYIEACTLIKNKKSSRKFKDEDGTGTVTTDGKRGSIGGLAGIIFHAQVDWRDKTIRCNYIVRDSDLVPEERVLEGALDWKELGEDDPADFWKNP